MSDYTSLRVDRDGGLAHITLTRPEKHQALDLAQGQDLESATARLTADPEVRAILLTAEGRSFHVGGDLGYFDSAEDKPAAVRTLTTLVHATAERLSRCQAPVVAAINGVCAGGGMGLMLSADLAIAAESAVFTMAYTNAGLTPDNSSTWYLPKFIGLRRAQEMIFLNRKLSAAEALDWGLITEVVPDDQLQDRAREVAVRLAAGPTRAHEGAKALLRSSYAQGLEAQMADESAWISRMMATDDATGAMKAFLAKERPEFNGS